MNSAAVSASDLQAALHAAQPPIVIDVRQETVYLAASEMIAGALHRDPDQALSWARSLPRAADITLYCRSGKTSQRVAQTLNGLGIPARYLDGGLQSWTAAGGEIDPKPLNSGTRWVTRERPKIDRIACPWLIARIVDPDAQFIYVPTEQVLDTANESDATPYDIPYVHFSHQGDLCSFDAFLKHYHLTDPALQRLALIVRGADTGKLDLAPQAAGLAAISIGLSRQFRDDHQMLKHGMVMYDALYAWCREGQDETHTWNPDAIARA
jgi:rhodanese-related sulfurtransferase